MRATFISLRTKSLENNNSQENTPTRPRPSWPPLRPPLQTRDHNAMVRSAPLTAKSGNAANNMPSYDKQNRPSMPTLSASATKTAHRMPLTPRVAGSAPTPASTPLGRRGARPDDNTPPFASSREDLSTPVSAFLSNNITPRSGSRKSRVDSTHTTPTGTPNGTPAPPSTNEFPRVAGHVPLFGSGLGIAGLDKDIAKRPTVSFSPTVSDVGRAKSPTPSAADTKFFFASEAKSVQAPPKPQLQAKNSSTFFYANGESIPPRPQSSSASAVGSSIGEERSQPKFFHANGTLDLQTSPSPYFPPPRPSSTVSSNSRITSSRPETGSPGTLSPPQRPVSPQKLNQHVPTSSLRNAPSLPSPLATRTQPQGRGQSTNSISVARKVNIEHGQRVISHGRSSSVDSPNSKTARRASSGSSLDFASPPPGTPLNLLTSTLPVSMPEEIPDEANPIPEGVPSGLQSPIKSGHSIEHMNELAANARRERKVLDLEITNSSLAAINRTLEREMRKQTAELRRYRRLSRSGRLSIATSASIRSASGTSSIMEALEGTQLSDMSEEETDSESELDSSGSESLDDRSLSPGAMAESDLRHRKKDEKRLQLDLSKHRQLLIDSQKMNQSLKRCLGWTEELISEGRKALDYHVRVSDVELGGRVLTPDEVEGTDDGVVVLGELGNDILREARLAAAAGGTAPWGGTGDGAGDSEVDAGAQREDFEEMMGMIPLQPLST